MLTHLLIENFILLDRLDLDFSKGLAVITGETGAGKSLIVDAIEGIIGGRLSPEQIKTNSKHSYLEGTFIINSVVKELLLENGFEDLDETITLSRTIQRSGNKCRINGQLVTQSFLKQIGEYLIDTIGQNENQYLFKVERHRGIIDALGDDNHKKILESVKDTSLKINIYKKEYEDLKKSSQENKRQIDFYKFQLNEIEEANLKTGEEKELKKEREILVHAEDLGKNLLEAYHELYASEETPSLCDRLNHISRLVSDSAKHDPSLENTSNELENINFQLQEISRSIRDYSEKVESDPERLEEVESRIDIITKMKNKYGQTVEEVLSYLSEISEKVKLVENSEEKLEYLTKNISVLEEKYKEQASDLTISRKKLAEYLEPKVEKELSELGMDKTKFRVNFMTKKDSFSENGSDGIEFLISPNPGEPLRPLAKTASGGETSRLMLSLKMVLHKSNQVPTLIFDEIDAGISGKAALVVSQKLAKLTELAQIICITHLPVVAAMSDQHLWIEKTSTEENTTVNIIVLDEKPRIEKLAQMTGAKISETSLQYARDIYNYALDYKKDFKIMVKNNE
ncbi:MAG: DNA repair protein RecN [Candidatus Sericytochromatia bacterium]|nr:DNA repair protein RecN [Candidatus Sericytochromatia bacterium]